MKHQKYIKLLYFLLTGIMLSCESNVELNKAQTVLECHLYNGQLPKIVLVETLEAFPQYAFNVEYYEQPYYINEYHSNIEISVSDGNKVFNNFKMHYEEIDNRYNSKDVYSQRITYFSDENFIAEAGKEYEIEIIELPEYQDHMFRFNYLKSKTKVPELIPVNIELKNDPSAYVRYNAEVTFDDPIDDNYYYLTATLVYGSDFFLMDTVDMEKLWREEHYSSIWMTNLLLDNMFYETIDGVTYYPDSFTAFNGYLLNDDEFNGQTKEFNFDIQEYNVEFESFYYVVVELMHISEEYYNYYNAIEKQRRSQTDIFSEPAQLYSNIENGLGIFAGATISTKYILIP